MKNGVPMKNGVIAILCKLMLIVFGLALQRVMATALGSANLGLNSVFGNIVSLLSLAEMGMSTAIVYHLYAPLERRDRQAVSALMHLFARSYRVIGLVVGAAGLALLPFVHLFLRDSAFSLAYVRTIFGLFVLKTSLSYFLAYRRSLLIADQRAYAVNLIETAAQAVSMALGIAILLATRSFAYYLIASAACTLGGNALISRYARKAYPDVDERAPIPPALQRDVFQKIRSVFVMRVSGAILNATDSLIISGFVGLVACGLYDNYHRLTSSVLAVITAMCGAMQPTLGHMAVTDSRASLSQTLQNYTFLLYGIASSCGVCLLCLMTPFVGGVWLTKEYVLPDAVVAICALNFFLVALRIPLWSLLEVSGLFEENRNCSIAGAATNLIVSLLLVKPMGMTGVFVGTFVSQALQVALKVRVLHRRFLGVSPRAFGWQWAGYFAAFALEAGLCWLLCGRTASFLVKLALCALLPCAINGLLFCKTARMRYLLGVVKPYWLRVRKGARHG